MEDANKIEEEKITDYEPYKEQIVPLDLKGNWVGAINDNIKDYLVTDKKKYWLVKFVGERIFTGDENWLYLDNRGNYYRYYLLNFEAGSGVRSILCNYFTDRGTNAIGEYPFIQLTANDLYIQIENVKTVSELKNLLKEKYESGNPVKVLYPLAQPQIIELGELPEPIKTFEGVNNIQVLANLDTEIEVKYALDVKKYFENKLASIQEQIL